MREGGREAFQSYLRKLEAVGFRPSRSMGQNFLLDPALNRFIAKSLEAKSEDVILEIGPGLGFLTRELAQRSRTVLAVELDRRLETVLREELTQMPAGDRVEVLHGDILGGGEGLNPAVIARLEAAMARSTNGRLLVGSNLPYSIAGPCLAALVTAERLPAGMIIMLQVELAERLTAAHGSKAYGRLSVLLGSLYRVSLLRRVGPEVFRPRPRVGSAIVRLVRREASHPSLTEASGRQDFARFLRQAFSARRKKLRGSLSQAPPVENQSLDLAALGSQGERRAGEIPIEEWPPLWRLVSGAFP